MRAISARGFKKKKNNIIPYSSSMPRRQHQHHNTMTNLYYVPSKIGHQGNPNKASKILGINSDAVILANHNRKKRKNQHRHRKSNSFSDKLSIKNIKNTISGNNSRIMHKPTTSKSISNEIEEEPQSNRDDMKMVEDDEDDEELKDDKDEFAEEDEEDYYEDDQEDDDYDDEMDDDELDDVKLKFNKFKPQKRNTGTMRRSQTVDFTNRKINFADPYGDNNNLMGSISPRNNVMNNNNNHSIAINRAQTFQLNQSMPHRNTITTISPRSSMGNNNMHNIHNMGNIPRRRSRLSISKSGGDSSDVIEISFRIDKTKKGYMFIGLIPANKINNVVQPGFMFGFNEYSWGFHGYSGKLYHDKIQSDYYYNNNNNGNNKRKNSNNNGQHTHTRAQTVDITSGIAASNNNNGNMLNGLDSIIGHNMENDRKENNEFINNFRNPPNTNITNTESDNILDRGDNNNHNHNNNNNTNNNNNNNGKTSAKCPVLKTGDIVTIKMKLNRNNNKFAVIYCINNIDYGIAWKTIDPPVTIGVTMVGRSEQISLLSCSYRPYKNDKSCVIL